MSERKRSCGYCTGVGLSCEKLNVQSEQDARMMFDKKGRHALAFGSIEECQGQYWISGRRPLLEKRASKDEDLLKVHQLVSCL